VQGVLGPAESLLSNGTCTRCGVGCVSWVLACPAWWLLLLELLGDCCHFEFLLTLCCFLRLPWGATNEAVYHTVDRVDNDTDDAGTAEAE
jgi:hypothetical protein